MDECQCRPRPQVYAGCLGWAIYCFDHTDFSNAYRRHFCIFAFQLNDNLSERLKRPLCYQLTTLYSNMVCRPVAKVSAGDG